MLMFPGLAPRQKIKHEAYQNGQAICKDLNASFKYSGGARARFRALGDEKCPKRRNIEVKKYMFQNQYLLPQRTG